MASPKVRLDSAGIEEILNRAAVRSAIESLGDQVAANVGTPTANGEPIDVVTRSRVAAGGRLRGTRPAVDIILAHPAGLRVEAKHGTLARAASAAGLEVKRKGR